MQLRDHPAKVGRVDAFKLDPREIKIDPAYNVRDMKSEHTRAHIEEIKVSLRDPKIGGIKKPIEVRMVGEDAYVTDGECRLTAALEVIAEGIDIKSIVCIHEAAGTDQIERILNFGTAGQGLRYTELEMAGWCRRALRAGATEEQIAAAAGWKSKASVDQHLKMLEMDNETKAMVAGDGDVTISATTAVNTFKQHGEKTAEVLKAAKVEAKAEGKTKIAPRHVAKVTGKTSKAKQASDSYLDFVANANTIADEAKRAGGIEKIPQERLVALAKGTVVTLAKAKGEKLEEPKSTPEPALDPAELDASAPLPSGDAGAPVEGVKSLDQLKEHIAGVTTGATVTQFRSDMLPHDLAADAGLPPEATAPAEFHQEFAERKRRAAQTQIDTVLLSFYNAADAAELAAIYAKIDREHDESSADGCDTDAQIRLIDVADNIGHLRFPDDWENAKASSELQQVA